MKRFEIDLYLVLMETVRVPKLLLRPRQAVLSICLLTHWVWFVAGGIDTGLF